MKTTIVVAGASGNLGGRIAKALVARGAEVRALVRSDTAADKVAAVDNLGATVVTVNDWNVAELTVACAGAACVVSALQGLREVIVDAQSVLLEAAVAAGVPRFIPSDYASDFTKLAPGENRNFDLRREFHVRLDAAPIAATSILNGGFMELLLGQMPLLDLDAHRVSYWQNPDQLLDFTTIDNTAEFAAAAALDASTPRVLRIAGDRVSVRDLAAIAGDMTGADFTLVDLGTIAELEVRIKRDRAADPAGEKQPYPRWQAMQYMHGMFSGRGALDVLDNARYPDIVWTSVRELLVDAHAHV
jgi:nucleoside-diphosphate-sugar epimerase